METSDRLVAEDPLKAFARDLFIAAGVPEGDAALIAGVLIWSNLRGVDSHGVLRIPGYLARIDSGITNADPNIQVVIDLSLIHISEPTRRS